MTDKIKVTSVPGGSITVSGLSEFSPAQIFDCGQCFRFDAAGMAGHGDKASLSGATEFTGVAMGRYIRVASIGDGEIRIDGASPEDWRDVWSGYFDIMTDYADVQRRVISAFSAACGHDDGHMRRCVDVGRGIRILRQDPFETLISFIISQNNNIPRIKKTIAALCERYGDAISGSGLTDVPQYAFPTPEAIICAGENGMRELKTGFRAPYIVGAARAVADGSLDLEALKKASGAEAREALTKLKGVGPKVASCVDLFGLGHKDAFPVDVWMKKVLSRHYPDGIDIPALGEYAGVGQQYLFYGERWISDSSPE